MCVLYLICDLYLDFYTRNYYRTSYLCLNLTRTQDWFAILFNSCAFHLWRMKWAIFFIRITRITNSFISSVHFRSLSFLKKVWSLPEIRSIFSRKIFLSIEACKSRNKERIIKSMNVHVSNEYDSFPFMFMLWAG